MGDLVVGYIFMESVWDSRNPPYLKGGRSQSIDFILKTSPTPIMPACPTGCR